MQKGRNMAYRLEDFGEKIGGARKDLWSGRGLLSSDIIEFNKLELDKYCVKKEVWKIDYKDLNLKYDIPTCYYISSVYKAIPSSPSFNFSETEESIRSKCTEYINTIQMIKNTILGCKDMEEMKNSIELYLNDNGYINYLAGRIKFTTKVYDSQVLSSYDCLQMLIMKNMDPSIYYTKMQHEANRKNFLKPRETILPRGYKIFKNKEGYYDVYKRQNSTVALISSLERNNGKPLETEEEAIAWAIAWQKDSRSKIVRYVPPVLNKIERDGPKYRRTGRHATGNMIMSRFDFRAGEYGNWMTEADRQVSLNHAYDSFSDIARSLNISYKDVGLNGNLAIAFASRGVKGAAAHYEPARKVINLTKLHGAGSLAHEWWHALDHYIANQLGVYTRSASISSSAEKYEPMNDLYRTMTYHEGKPTYFYLSSKKMDKQENASYWSKPEEMCARAFACYIHDRLGYKNDYLTGHAYCSPAIPFDDERIRIFDKFDSLFSSLVKDNILTKDDHQQEKENEKAAEDNLKIVNQAATEINNLTFDYENMTVDTGNQISFEDLFSILRNDIESEKVLENEIDSDKEADLDSGTVEQEISEQFVVEYEPEL